MKKRPWLWIVFAYAIFIALTLSFVVIAVKNKQAEVPLKPVAARQ
jgi:hypothetical protein